MAGRDSTPVDLIAALAAECTGRRRLAWVLALVQAKPRAPRLAQALVGAGLGRRVPGRSSCRDGWRSRPGLLQVHDFWDASHEAAQQADDLGERDFSAYWHGIAHRREPDAGNAAYWFRRVGRHPVFTPLARRPGRCSTSTAIRRSRER